MKHKDPGCSVCAVIERFNLPEDSHELFHRYIDKIDEMSELLDEALQAGFNFEEGDFDAALDELAGENEVPPKSQLN